MRLYPRVGCRDSPVVDGALLVPAELPPILSQRCPSRSLLRAHGDAFTFFSRVSPVIAARRLLRLLDQVSSADMVPQYSGSGARARRKLATPSSSGSIGALGLNGHARVSKRGPGAGARRTEPSRHRAGRATSRPACDGSSSSVTANVARGRTSTAAVAARHTFSKSITSSPIASAASGTSRTCICSARRTTCSKPGVCSGQPRALVKHAHEVREGYPGHDASTYPAVKPRNTLQRARRGRVQVASQPAQKPARGGGSLLPSETGSVLPSAEVPAHDPRRICRKGPSPRAAWGLHKGWVTQTTRDVGESSVA